MPANGPTGASHTRKFDRDDERSVEAQLRREAQIQLVGPCDCCRHLQRCSGAELACAALELYRNAGRVSPLAPRQPSHLIFKRMASAKPRRTAQERQAQREALAVSMQRDAIA